jgi:hypothetical protein
MGPLRKKANWARTCWLDNRAYSFKGEANRKFGLIDEDNEVSRVHDKAHSENWLSAENL